MARPRVRLTASQAGEELLSADFLYLVGGIPVLSDRAVEVTRGMLEHCGELLPLRCDDGDYSAFNVLNILDVMDEEQSEADYLGPGRLVSLRHLVARRPLPDELSPVFKLPQWLKGRALITQRFVDLVLANQLRGLDPRPVGEI